MECVEICPLAAVVHELHQHEMVGRRTVGRVEQHGRREANTEIKKGTIRFRKKLFITSHPPVDLHGHHAVNLLIQYLNFLLQTPQIWSKGAILRFL